MAGPSPGLPAAARRDCPRLVAVERIGTRNAAAIRRVLLPAGGSAFFSGARGSPGLKPWPVPAKPASAGWAGGQDMAAGEPPSQATPSGSGVPDPERSASDQAPLLLSGPPAAFAHLFMTMEEPRRGLWEALSHALAAYDTALANTTPTRIMGVLNVTPDSFSDGGQYLDPGAAEAQAWRMVEEGAQILDIGGESTRPGAEPVPAGEELRRVLPVVRRLAGKVRAELSIDTTKTAVARACLDAGATIINDVSGLTFDPKLALVVARAGAILVLMHMRGTPRTMQEAPEYDDVVADTMRFLRRQMHAAMEAGVKRERLWIDPGFGFGKTVQNNLEILSRLREYTSIGAPILIGTSRKSTLGRVLGDLPASERLEATAATVAVAIANGAAIVRVHDVKEMARVAQMTDAIFGRGEAGTKTERVS